MFYLLEPGGNKTKFVFEKITERLIYNLTTKKFKDQQIFLVLPLNTHNQAYNFFKLNLNCVKFETFIYYVYISLNSS